MSDIIYKKRRQAKEARLVIVADMYKKGASVRKIAVAVMEKMQLEKVPATGTIFNDIQSLLKEWRTTRIDDIDLAIQLELERIDEAVHELWEAWTRSKTNHEATTEKKKGNIAGKGKVTTSQIEKTVKEEIKDGDPRYIAEIRQQLAERRKLMGLYAPEKRELSGELGFYSLLKESSNQDEK